MFRNERSTHVSNQSQIHTQSYEEGITTNISGISITKAILAIIAVGAIITVGALYGIELAGATAGLLLISLIVFVAIKALFKRLETTPSKEQRYDSITRRPISITDDEEYKRESFFGSRIAQPYSGNGALDFSGLPQQIISTNSNSSK